MTAANPQVIRCALTVWLLAGAGCSSLPLSTGESHSRGAMETGVYPDLFHELLARDSAETRERISRAWAWSGCVSSPG